MKQPHGLTEIGYRRLRHWLRKSATFPTLKRILPSPWQVELTLVTAPAMKKLNHRHRGKDYATDVLSFPSPNVFRRQGHLGELLICLPVLRRQAKEAGHSERRELDVLLVHGILHLLGFDHERGRKQAAQMARWEERLLQGARKGGTGLIARSDSGISARYER